jgi:DNA polymerase I-like protein with 3'-5' exonuclease and polymerase domains
MAPATSSDSDDDAAYFLSIMQTEREVPNPEKPWMKHHKFVLVTSVDQINQIVDSAIAAGKCALDLETEGLDNRINYDANGAPQTVHQIVGYCLSYDGHTGYYVPVGHRVIEGEDNPNLPRDEVNAAIRRLCIAAQPVMDPSDPDPLGGKTWLEPPKVIIGFWHAKFDQEFLYPVTGIDFYHPDSFHDGYLASFVLYTNDVLGLKEKAAEKLRDPDGNPYEMIKLQELFIRGRDIEFAELDPREEGVVKYACSDGICTYKLCFESDIPTRVADKKFTGIYRLEKQVSQVIRVMERNRVKIDKAEVQRVMLEAQAERDEYERKIQALAESKGFHNFNPGSTKQLSDFLFGEDGLNLTPKPEKNEKSGNYKTDAKTLEGLIEDLPEDEAKDNVLVWIVKHRQIDKILGTYLTNMVNNTDELDQLRFQFNQTGAATGRFSAPAGDPAHGYGGVPPQGIPSRSDPKRPKCANSLRRTFVARAGYTLAKCDYAGQELRVVTNLSGEPVWMKEFIEGDGDLHSITARAFFGKEDVTSEERGAGKRANFALVYGGGPAAIMRATGCNKIEGKRRKQAFDKAVPTFAKWVENQHKSVKKELGVCTAFGRWLAIPDANSPDHQIQAACERYSTNYPIQGSGSDIMKISLVKMHKEFTKRGWLKVGGDDSVRMLLTVHDEVVFEIRHDLVPIVIPVIVEIMESPTFMARPAWKVPLVVEPLLGLAWDGKYDWGKMRHGRKAKPNEQPKEKEYAVEDRIYQCVPPWLTDILAFKGGHLVKPGTDELPEAPSPAVVEAIANAVASVPVKPAEVKPTSAPPPAVPPPPAPVATQDGGLAEFCIETLTRNTARIVSVVCMEARDVDAGKVLRLVDIHGNLLVDPRLQIRVDPDHFLREMRKYNLGVGRILGKS